MTLTIIHNGKELKHTIPTSWDNVTFGQFLKLGECGNDRIKVLSLFTGIDYDDLKKSRVINLDGVLELLRFLDKEPEPRAPKEILGYPVPENLEFEQVQMYLDLTNYLKETKDATPEDKLKQYTKYVAVYCVLKRFGTYDWKLVEEMAPLFLKAPCTEVMGIGNFTLVRLIGLNLSTKVTFPPPGTRMMRLRLAIKGYLLRMGRYFPSFTLKTKPG
jgi:hypothetical protein